MTKGEQKIHDILIKSHYRFIQEKTFTDLKGGKYRYDFYLPDLCGGTLIEFDGEQHFHQVKQFQKTHADFLKTQGHDRQKNSYALGHDIPLYRIPYWELPQINTFDDIFTDKHKVRSKYHNDDLSEKSVASH